MLNRPIAYVAPVRIVVAAAEAAFRNTLRRQLELEPQVRIVGEAPDSQVASSLIYRLTPDLVVIECELNRDLAIHRPTANGNSGPSLNIVVLITSAEPRHLVEALELGARGVVLKASLPARWGPGIERVIAGQYWVPDESIAILLQAVRRVLVQPGNAQTEVRNAQSEIPQLREFGLTPRETEIARKVASGRSNKELGREFAICERTVKHHLTNIFRKVGVSSRLELAVLVRDGVTYQQASLNPFPALADAKSNAD